MSNLIQAITEKNYSVAAQKFQEKMTAITESQLLEKKKEVAHNLTERCGDTSDVKSIAKKTAKAAVKAHVTRAHKAKQTKSLRSAFGVAPGKRRHQGPKVAKLEEMVRRIHENYWKEKQLKAQDNDDSPPFKPDPKGAEKHTSKNLARRGKKEMIRKLKQKLDEALHRTVRSRKLGARGGKSLLSPSKGGTKDTSKDEKAWRKSISDAQDKDDDPKTMRESIINETLRKRATKEREKAVTNANKEFWKSAIGKRNAGTYHAAQLKADRAEILQDVSYKDENKHPIGGRKEALKKAVKLRIREKKWESRAKKEDKPDFVRREKESSSERMDRDALKKAGKERKEKIHFKSKQKLDEKAWRKSISDAQDKDDDPKTMREGKWDYPSKMTTKIHHGDADYLGYDDSKRNRKERKDWRKKIKAKAHKALMSGKKD